MRGAGERAREGRRRRVRRVWARKFTWWIISKPSWVSQGTGRGVEPMPALLLKAWMLVGFGFWCGL